MNYFLYKIYGGDTLFSEAPIGEVFTWGIDNIVPNKTFSEGDVIIGYSSPSVFYLLKVHDVSSTRIKLIKELELTNDKHIDFSSGENIKVLSESDYKKLLSELLSTYVLSGSVGATIAPITSDMKPKNIIYFGAPGTGKSYTVDQIIKDQDKKYYERVSFHPDYDHASFVGGYKPITEKIVYEKDGEEIKEDQIRYKFVPQAFATIYKRAWQDLDNKYYLVIEEINRGNCAEIFGDIFQLLDRTSNYNVSPSTELYRYLLEEFGGDENHPGIKNGLRLPLNLDIYATMNTSDQSLYPMDSAFKRRWDWEYIPICYNEYTEEGQENASFKYLVKVEDKEYSWIKFIEIINNNHIKNNPSLGMDKCIGNYFIKPEDGYFITLKQFVNKVIFYLWNDVFKEEDNIVFEQDGSYEDFFPIGYNGLSKVKELFERIELEAEQSTSVGEEVE
ncbi:McrB family protein [Myroides guanonis]|uniref:AAA domain (Dynein-related subfamily) n=1 Tax=Myroides guanonis TaxID=1150112 RepID=A0A1I3PLH9_9FLAO|nr:AAA family ATPase [Myroides guanonis]SFJ22408.1 AAA domain (dynein-related subfamily) [Myroides guanonis]